MCGHFAYPDEGTQEAILGLSHRPPVLATNDGLHLFWGRPGQRPSVHQQILIYRGQKNQQQCERDAFLTGRSLKVRATSSIACTPSSLRE